MSTITVTNLGKAYKKYPNKLSRLLDWIIPGQPKRHELKWVLKDINFIVNPGEAVGVVGMNGAGKSTLLKIITGTSGPTLGKVGINGHVSALLELGMGFHPDFTGRQNIYMAGQLLGISNQEIQQLMPEIEDFSEIGDYMDQPVRIYSSGMQMRVAFAVATARRPEVLIVDEALSVGDAYFQHKSFARIRKFRELGTTLLIVSHDRNAIQSICDRVILLDQGRVIKDSYPEEVFDFYNALIAENENNRVQLNKLDDGRTQTTSGTGEARVEEINLVNSDGLIADHIGVGEEVEIRVKIKVYHPIETLVFGFGIKDRLGQVMYGTNTWHTEQVIHKPMPGSEYLVTLAFPANFGVGSYSVQTALVDRDTHLTANYEWRDMALLFNVININKKHFAGCMWNEPNISIRSLSG